MKATNRTRILSEAIPLFNQFGISRITTNHICRHLRISPGNLYFHFLDKEEILRELFQQMCQETYAMWKQELNAEKFAPPLRFMEQSLEVFWKFRFFHREMYSLRRQDVELNKAWHIHMRKTRRFMKIAYMNWVKTGQMRRINDAHAMRVLNDIVLATASSFFQFLESVDRSPSRRQVQLANQYLKYFLQPYLTEV